MRGHDANDADAGYHYDGAFHDNQHFGVGGFGAQDAGNMRPGLQVEARSIAKDIPNILGRAKHKP